MNRPFGRNTLRARSVHVAATAATHSEQERNMSRFRTVNNTAWKPMGTASA